MVTDSPTPRIVRFGVFELDLQTAELHKRGVKVALQEQPFQVLAMLVERPGELVTREELRQKLWSDAVFVDFDHGLNKAVGKIRRALGDLAESPRFVETLERRGYRFIAPVEIVGEPMIAAREKIIASTSRVVRLLWNERAIPLSVGAHILGRDPAAAVWIDSSVVSRRHAQLVIADETITLEDLGSHNGTFVNGTRIEGARPLTHGDEIRVGPATMTLHAPTDAVATLTEKQT